MRNLKKIPLLDLMPVAVEEARKMFRDVGQYEQSKVFMDDWEGDPKWHIHEDVVEEFAKGELDIKELWENFFMPHTNFLMSIPFHEENMARCTEACFYVMWDPTREEKEFMICAFRKFDKSVSFDGICVSTPEGIRTGHPKGTNDNANAWLKAAAMIVMDLVQRVGKETVEAHEIKRKGKRTNPFKSRRGVERLKRQGYSLIKLMREDHIRKISVAEAEGAGTQNRQHYVRGHWRTCSSGKRTFVKPHKRGNPELGRIKQEYFLT